MAEKSSGQNIYKIRLTPSSFGRSAILSYNHLCSFPKPQTPTPKPPNCLPHISLHGFVEVQENRSLRLSRDAEEPQHSFWVGHLENHWIVANSETISIHGILQGWALLLTGSAHNSNWDGAWKLWEFRPMRKRCTPEIRCLVSKMTLKSAGPSAKSLVGADECGVTRISTWACQTLRVR